MTLHWQILWIASGGLHLVFAVSLKVIMPWSCLVDLMDDQYTVGGNTLVIRGITSVSSLELTNLSFMLVQNPVPPRC